MHPELTPERAERAELLREWGVHFQYAVRYGSQHPGAIADVLTFGSSQEVR
jgi:hypothetical protein